VSVSDIRLYILYYTKFIVKRLDGRPEPTELPKSTPSFSNTPATSESTMERETRLKKEAQERLRAKFGEGGMNSQAGGSSNWSGANTPSSRGAEWSGGALPVSADDVLASVTSLWNTAVTKTSEITKKVGEHELTKKTVEKAKEGWSTAVNTVTDPKLADNVKTTAASTWSWLSDTTGSLIASAATLIDPHSATPSFTSTDNQTYHPPDVNHSNMDPTFNGNGINLNPYPPSKSSRGNSIPDLSEFVGDGDKKGPSLPPF
jgi:hypothetical protein